MSNSFFNLSPDEQSALIRMAGERLDVPDMIIEKIYGFVGCLKNYLPYQRKWHLKVELPYQKYLL